MMKGWGTFYGDRTVPKSQTSAVVKFNKFYICPLKIMMELFKNYEQPSFHFEFAVSGGYSNCK